MLLPLGPPLKEVQLCLGVGIQASAMIVLQIVTHFLFVFKGSFLLSVFSCRIPHLGPCVRQIPRGITQGKQGRATRHLHDSKCCDLTVKGPGYRSAGLCAEPCSAL